MKALTIDDLLPLEEFAARRREFFESHIRYLDRYRRVRLGPRLCLLFENRQTLWFRVQEILRVARLAKRDWVERELAIYNRLLPAVDRLQAALVICAEDETSDSDDFIVLQKLQGPNLGCHLGNARVPADLLTCRPEDRCLGASHWVQFMLDDSARRRLGDDRFPVHFSIDLPRYCHDSGPLSDDVRQSLLDDLLPCDRAG